jgi:putative ABC transport system ATP-binding protein
MLSLKRLSKIYRKLKVETTALRSVDLEIATGDFVAVMGPSGCGKSTLLNIIGMLDTPSSGEYWFGGRNIAGCSEAQLSELRKNSLEFVFQSFNLVDELNVFENVELALLYHRDVPSRERRARVCEALERMNISHCARQRPQQLSGGQQQRVAIARAVVSRPKLILADEPTGNLDSATGEEVMQLLRELNREGTTIIMATHSRPHAEYAHRVVKLLDGAVDTEKVRLAPGAHHLEVVVREPQSTIEAGSSNSG